MAPLSWPGKAGELAGGHWEGDRRLPQHSETLLLDRQGLWQRHRIPIMTPSRWKKASAYPVHLIAF